ncbi:MAG TPA: metallophosphoesterase [Terriglobales bacterium]|jgi:3',5'-cyclic AMP phosphodiesterase CpdA|nr:metallophosphoesterase [Terriglobales bacterium]
MKDVDRRSFLRISGAALGIGVLYQVAPIATAEAAETFRMLGRNNGEAITPFSFVQLSDAHVGFNGPPDPLGTKAFERAVEMVNALPHQPDLVLFTGDLTHDSEDKDVHAKRMKDFREIAGRLTAKKLMCVPGEHDAGLDGGALFRENYGPTNYSFDHRGIHFIALDNVSRAKPEVGSEQIAWMKKDLARFPKSAPIVVFTHRPLFDLKPEWEWFTSDGDDVMNALAGYENVTVLYGHIHRDDEHEVGHAHHYAARSLIFAFPEPTAPVKKPYPFDKDAPFKNLGIRVVNAAPKQPITVRDVELTLREYSGLNGIQQVLKNPTL